MLKTVSNFPPIPIDKLETMLNKPIHLAWGNHGTVWILEKIDGDTLHLRTPKTGKRLTAHAKDACYVRRLQPS